MLLILLRSVTTLHKTRLNSIIIHTKGNNYPSGNEVKSYFSIFQVPTNPGSVANGEGDKPRPDHQVVHHAGARGDGRASRADHERYILLEAIFALRLL